MTVGLGFFFHVIMNNSMSRIREKMKGMVLFALYFVFLLFFAPLRTLFQFLQKMGPLQMFF